MENLLIDKKILEHFRENFNDCAEYIVDEAPNLEALELFTKSIVENSVKDLLIFKTKHTNIFDELISMDF